MSRLDATLGTTPGAEGRGGCATLSKTTRRGLDDYADVVVEAVVEGFSDISLGTPRDGSAAEAGAPPSALAARRVLAAV